MARGDGYSVIKRKRNGRELRNYEVRIQVPAAWQGVVGKKEVLLSLGTGDKRAANLAAPQVVADKYAEWRRMAGEDSRASQLDATAVAVGVGFDSMFAAMEDRRKAWPADDAEYAQRLADRQAKLLSWTRKLHDGDLSQWEGVADRVIASRGLAIAKGSDEYVGFVQTIAESTIDAISVFTRRATGELHAEPRSPIVRDVKAKEASKAKPGESIMELFERWADEALAKDAVRPDTVNQNRKVLQLFAEFVGHDRAIDSITPQEVYDYREARRAVPPKWSMKREFRDLSLREAAAKARGMDLPKTSFVTINRELSTISPLYAWVAGQPRWAGLKNPCEGLYYGDVKGKNPRPPFTTEQLSAILASPLFTGFQADGKEHVSGSMHADDWRRWIPLAAMFTGARIGEIAQLRIGDVRQERGVWFVHMLEDADAGLAVKNRKARSVPVHSRLEAIGFIEFVQRQSERAGGRTDSPLFPELVKNDRGHIGAEPSEWWRDYLQAIGIKKGADGFGAHSFRHTLSDRLRSEAELLDNEIAVCLGHSQASVTGGYGRLSQGTVNMLKQWLEAVTWEGVDFTPLERKLPKAA